MKNGGTSTRSYVYQCFLWYSDLVAIIYNRLTYNIFNNSLLNKLYKKNNIIIEIRNKGKMLCASFIFISFYSFLS